MNFDLFNDSDSCYALNIPHADCSLYPNLFDSTVADIIFNELNKSVTWSQEVIAMYGKKINVPRLSAWYGEPELSYEYSGIKAHALPWLPVIKTIKQKIELVSGTTFNSVLINLYRDENDSVDWHSDDEPELGKDPTIASVSFGEQRQFHLKNKTDTTIKTSLLLPHGSLLLMKGQTQTNYAHKISKSTRPLQARINLTFRTIIN